MVDKQLAVAAFSSVPFSSALLLLVEQAGTSGNAACFSRVNVRSLKNEAGVMVEAMHV